MENSNKQQRLSPWVRRALDRTLPIAVDGGAATDPKGALHVLSRSRAEAGVPGLRRPAAPEDALDR